VVEVKAMLSPGFIKHHAVNSYGVEGVQLLASSLDGVEWSASLPGSLTPRNE
jgi:hypothetical protein